MSVFAHLPGERGCGGVDFRNLPRRGVDFRNLPGEGERGRAGAEFRNLPGELEACVYFRNLPGGFLFSQSTGEVGWAMGCFDSRNLPGRGASIFAIYGEIREGVDFRNSTGGE